VLTPNGTGLKATDFNTSRDLAMSRDRQSIIKDGLRVSLR